MHLARVIAWRAREQPMAPAVIDGARVLGYGALDRAVRHGIAWLREQDVRSGARVALTLVDPLAHLILSLALLRLGATQTSLQPGLPLSMRADLARAAGVVLTVADATADVVRRQLERGVAPTDWVRLDGTGDAEATQARVRVALGAAGITPR